MDWEDYAQYVENDFENQKSYNGEKIKYPHLTYLKLFLKRFLIKFKNILDNI